MALFHHYLLPSAVHAALPAQIGALRTIQSGVGAKGTTRPLTGSIDDRASSTTPRAHPSCATRTGIANGSMVKSRAEQIPRSAAHRRWNGCL
jgi:hypothetical protein